ncbi:hypothetical protein J5N97_002774 [Dioscorea zingiberensis]|uniref:Dol-P-Glc:Glc(2)Man(9)GlcNAc(2)-PP-Dol alpha-1,2-glucosyltransferase n=1 Tax=Dioscorea zingiberensis TaxID=325984 RepID=A0A9D5D3G0_9LILI|nr:hypothetical protein J5N97_002774 [Dioscorea zingiberensis]
MELLSPASPPRRAADRFAETPPRASLRSALIPTVASLSLGTGDGSERRVYVAVGKSPEKTAALLRWTFRHFRCKEVSLLQVHQPSLTIPTLLGRLPVSQANDGLVSAYRKVERGDTKRALLSYLAICYRDQVQGKIVMTEAGQIADGILDVVAKHKIHNLVMGEIPDNCFKVKGRSNLTTYIAKKAPPFCEIWFVGKGKVVWTRESGSANPCDSRNSTSFTGASSFFISPVDGKSLSLFNIQELDMEVWPNRRKELMMNIEKSKKEASIKVAKCKELESEMAEALSECRDRRKLTLEIVKELEELHSMEARPLGALAILFRQTNVVWMMFVAANGAMNYIEDFNRRDRFLQDHTNIVKESDVLTNKKRVAITSKLRRRSIESSIKDLSLSNSRVANNIINQAQGFIGDIRDVVLRLWWLKREVLTALAPFIVVVVAFLVFVIWNGSIVLGAKEAHTVTPHFVQMLYFGLTSAAALAPVHFTLKQAWILCQWLMKTKILSSLQIITALIMGLMMVHFFSIAHPYLLADNRHYPFYVWRKVIQAHWLSKYLLVPIYVYSWFSIINILGRAQKRIWILLFISTTALVVIPAPLIEFRYFTIPFYLMLLHSRLSDNLSWLVMGILYVFVNIFTMAVFLFRPFHWDHEPGTQRFIW